MRRTTDLLRWPLWSWRNLGLTAGAVLLILVGIGQLAGPSSASVESEPRPAALQSATHAQTPSQVQKPEWPGPIAERTASAEPVPTAEGRRPKTPAGAGPRERPDVHSSPAEVAVAFVHAWARPDLKPPAWRRGIRPLVTPDLAKALSDTNPTRVPATRATGPARHVHTDGRRAEATIPTDAGRVLVELTRSGKRWRVANIQPAGQPPGAPTPNLQPTGGSRRGA